VCVWYLFFLVGFFFFLSSRSYCFFSRIFFSAPMALTPTGDGLMSVFPTPGCVWPVLFWVFFLLGFSLKEGWLLFYGASFYLHAMALQRKGLFSMFLKEIPHGLPSPPLTFVEVSLDGKKMTFPRSFFSFSLLPFVVILFLKYVLRRSPTVVGFSSLHFSDVPGFSSH